MAEPPEETNIVNLCLEYFITTNRRIFKIDNVFNLNDIHYTEKNFKLKHYEKLKSIDKMFKCSSPDNIEIDIKIVACKAYNDTVCVDKTCSNLHICEYELKRGCGKTFCQKEHALDTDHNQKVLNNANLSGVDVRLLKKMFQNVKGGFNELNGSSSHNRRLRPKPNIDSNNNNNYNRTIEVTLSDKFCVNENIEYIQLLFSNEKVTGGGDIVDVKFTPENFKALVTYEDANVAKRVVDKNFIEYRNYKFIVKFSYQLPIQKRTYETDQSINIGKHYADKTDRSIDIGKYNIIGTVNERKYQSDRQSNNKKDSKYSDIKADDKVTLTKDLKHNRFLRLIMDDKNIIWHKMFSENIQVKNGSVKKTRGMLIIESLYLDKQDEVGTKKWRNDIESTISSFLHEFSIPKLIQKDLSESIIAANVTEFNASFPNSVSYVKDERDLYLLIKRYHNEEFYKRYPAFSNNENFKESSVSIPTFENNCFYNIIDEILSKFKEKYGGSFKKEQNKVILKEMDKKNMDLVIDKLKDAFNHIEYKMLKIKECREVARCNGIKRVLESFYSNIKNYLCLFDINASNGVYLIYLRDCPHLDSPSNSVYDEVQKCIDAHFTSVIIDVTEYSDLMKTEKWDLFRKTTLNENKNREKLTYTFFNKNKIRVCLIFGYIEDVQVLKQKIEDFLNVNKVVTRKLDICHDDIMYLKHVVKNLDEVTKNFGTDMKLEFKELDKCIELFLNNCPEYLFNNVNNLIISKCKNKKMKKVDFNAIPGLEKIFGKSNLTFIHELNNLQKETKTFIEYKLSYHDIVIKSDLDEMKKIEIPSKLKQVIMTEPNTLKIGNCVLKLKLGNIVIDQADVIVNSTRNELNLNSGNLSKLFYKEAGPQIKTECVLKYPHGIQYGSIAVTSCGKMTNCKKLYHASCSFFDANNSDESISVLEKTIKTCLQQLKIDGYESISIPSIGTGYLNYPPNEAVKATLRTVIEFFLENYIKSYKVNIVVFDTDVTTYNAFKDEIQKQIVKLQTSYVLPDQQRVATLTPVKTGCDTNWPMLPTSNVIKTITRTSAKFTLIGDDILNLEKACGKLIEIIHTNYIKKQVINDECLKNNKLDDILCQTEDLEVTRSQDGTINIHGYKDDVIKTVDKIKDLIIKTKDDINNNIKKIMTTKIKDENIEWQYEIGNKWKPFNLFVNSHIEEAFYLKKDHVQLITDFNDKNAIIYFDEMQCISDESICNVRRTIVPKNAFEKLIFPSSWTKMNNDDEYQLILVDPFSDNVEYNSVIGDFNIKFGRIANIIKLERIQNPSLYRLFQIYKEYLEKKSSNSNEKYLFHGTIGESITSICRYGFDRSYCGKNGTAYGQGVYFAVNSSYSDRYAGHCSSGQKQMFRARVLVGDTTIGSSLMKVPPNKADGKKYDSTRDSSSSIFVCYNDNQCYPEYLITYL